MADIRSYLREKKRRESKQADYRDRIIRHKLSHVYRFLLVIVGILAVVALVILQYRKHIYTEYEVLSTVERERVSGASDLRLGNSILTYSKDGAHCTNAKGKVTWNQTYEIQDAKIAVCGDTVAIADYNGRTIYVQNSESQISQITTTMPIREVAVSASGYVTAVLDGQNLAWINTYDPSGELVFQGQARMSETGYPEAISLSPDGELLCVAYWYVDAGILKTDIAFYNFGQVGQNNSDFLVSASSYTDMLVPQVCFMNNSTAFAVGDNRLMIYTGEHKPVSKAEHILSEEIYAVYHSDKYVGLVFRSEVSEHLYRMDVYDTSAEKKGSFYIDIEYTDIFFGKDNFVVYNEKECMIMNMAGVQKFSGTFGKTVRLMLPADGAYRYTLVTDDSIDTIQLK
ncbi:MAG: DUF5711 family protein [Acetatifactor sp.]